MIQIKNTKQIMIAFIIFVVLFYFFSDKIVAMLDGDHPLVILAITLLLSPVYLIFIWILYSNYGFRGALAGTLISLASDIISLPHVLNLVGEKYMETWNFIPDLIVWNLLPGFLHNSFGIFLVYVGIPILFIVSSFMILHKKTFKQIFMKSI